MNRSYSCRVGANRFLAAILVVVESLNNEPFWILGAFLISNTLILVIAHFYKHLFYKVYLRMSSRR